MRYLSRYGHLLLGSIVLVFALGALYLTAQSPIAMAYGSRSYPQCEDATSPKLERQSAQDNEARTYLPLLQACSVVTPTPTPDPWTTPAAAIEVFSPVASAIYHSPIEITGYSRTFEGNVVIRLRDASNAVIAERSTLGGSVDGYDFFHTRLRFYVNLPQNGVVEVFEISAEDGSEIHKVTIPVMLAPGQRVLDVDVPSVGASVCPPVIVSGYSNTFEANVVVELSARSGETITMTTAFGGNLGFYDEFNASLDYSGPLPRAALVSAYEEDAQGLGRVDLTRVPVSLYACP